VDDMKVTVGLEVKVQDMWIGVFWKVTDYTPTPNYARVWDIDIWICLVPMLPIHIRIERWRKRIWVATAGQEGEGG
jgi:hypothetical protein